MKSKIGWCSMTFNPIVGCKQNCVYCYAQKINKRFKFIKNWNNPEWKEKSFNKKFPKKSQRIFVGSMSEIYYWKTEWMERVLEKVEQYPQHIFQFLTKDSYFYGKIVSYTFPKNCWLGITITNNKEAWNAEFRIAPQNTGLIKFVNIEPILGEIKSEALNHLKIDWLILGAETGNRKDKVIPKIEWIENIIEKCRMRKIPIYLKDSIVKRFPELIDKCPTFHQFPDFYK